MPRTEDCVPFAGFKDFAACVKANQSKDDPKGYCATIMRAVEKADKEYPDVVVKDPKRFTVAKIDEARQQVFGWISVAKGADGEPLEDLQGDIIEIGELEPAVYDFVLKSRIGTDLHDAPIRGQLIESFVVTPEKLEAMGLTAAGAPREAWLGGFKFDTETFGKVLKGDRTMFSIKGEAERVEV